MPVLQMIGEKVIKGEGQDVDAGSDLSYFTFLNDKRMEKEISHNKEVVSVSSVTSSAKSLHCLFTSSSAIRMRLFESDKYCKYAENSLRLLKTKIQTLLEARNNAIKTRDELMNRDKINLTSLESLFQIQSELYHFKCDVKAEYIKAEEAIKYKKTKYESIIISYKSQWEKVEEACKKLPMASELFTIERQNEALLEEAKNLNHLFEITRIDFWDKYGILMSDLYTKIIEFTKEYRNYLKYLGLTHELRLKSIQMQELLQILCKKDSALQNQGFFNQTSFETNIPAPGNEENKSFSNLTDFDDVLIPLENLELEANLPTEEGSFIYKKERKTKKIHKNPKIIHKSDKPDAIMSNENYTNPDGVKDDIRREAGGLNNKENKEVSSKSKNCEILSENKLDNGLNEIKPTPSECDKVNDADATSRYGKLQDKEEKHCLEPLKVTSGLKKKERIGLREKKVKQGACSRAKGESLPKRLKPSVENKDFSNKPTNFDEGKILDNLILPINEVTSLSVDKRGNSNQEIPLNKEQAKVSEVIQSPAVDDGSRHSKGNEIATPISENSNEESAQNEFMFFMDGAKSAKKGTNSIFNLF